MSARIDPTCNPTLFELEQAGARDAIRPDEFAAHVAAGVTRVLLRHEHRAIGSPGNPAMIRATLERELTAVQRAVERWAAGEIDRGRI